MGLTTIAENVESNEALARLAVIGVPYIQGHLAGEPVSFDRYFSYAQAA